MSGHAQGKLKPGDRLPSIRELVRRTSLSQTTVEHALALLQDEGLIRTIPQAGCYVTGLEPRQPRLLSTPAASRRDEAAPPDLPEPLWDLQTNAIHPELFDMKLWKRFLRQTLEESRTLASYGDSQGEPALRQALADHLFRLRRLRTDPDSILVGPSYQTLLFMLATLIGKPLTVAMEHHAPALARNAFQSAGWRILELDSDKDGPLPQELTKPFDCLYLTTACAGTKKKALRNRLDLYQDLFVIEDDYNGELTYASGPRNALSARLKHSVYIGSFSRVLLPSLRLSCMVLPKELLSRFDPASYAPMASRIEQLALARYIASGNLEKHIRRLNRIYRRRSDLLMNILRIFPCCWMKPISAWRSRDMPCLQSLPAAVLSQACGFPSPLCRTPVWKLLSRPSGTAFSQWIVHRGPCPGTRSRNAQEGGIRLPECRTLPDPPPAPPPAPHTRPHTARDGSAHRSPDPGLPPPSDTAGRPPVPPAPGDPPDPECCRAPHSSTLSDPDPSRTSADTDPPDKVL